VHLPVRGSQPGGRRRDLPAEAGPLDRLVARLGVEIRRLRREGGPDRGAALGVDDRVARDPVEPGAEAGARRIEAVGVPPDAREDVLDDLLRELAVAEAVDGEAV